MNRPDNFPMEYVPRKRYGFCIAVSNERIVQGLTYDLFQAYLFTPHDPHGDRLNFMEGIDADGKTQKEAVDKCLKNIKEAIKRHCNAS